MANANIVKLLAISSSSAVLIVIFFLLFFTNMPFIFRKNEPEKKGEEAYFQSIQQVTANGVNAEAYWSFDGKKLVFQAIRDGFKCDQIFTMNRDGSDIRLVSNGKGRTTCSYFSKDGQYVFYSSTMDSMGEGCPPAPDSSAGYVWPVYKSMNLYKANATTGEIVQQLTHSDTSYDAEATLSPDGQRIVFTSVRDGDLELYTMNTDGTGLKRLTYAPGYDGGAFFSHDGSKIVWRANRPRGQNLVEYMTLLNLGMVEPISNPMEIYTMNVDGSNQKKITNIGGSNFAPTFLPDDSGIIFASNLGKGPDFHLYTVDLNGKGLTQITTEGSFNLFPHFSPDGKHLVWESNRNSSMPHELNVFVAEWKGFTYSSPFYPNN